MPLDDLLFSPTSDFHCHFRDGDMMELVIPCIEDGGCDLVYVMPNLQPPITTVAAALSYHARLQPLAPDVTFLMTLYLHSSLTPADMAEAAAAGIVGVKAYPMGLTTHSEAGVVDYESYYSIFEAMQEHDLVLNLHGEAPSTPATAFMNTGGAEAINVLNAEIAFLPVLHQIHKAFPRLRIVFEHCSSKEAINAVRTCGPTVAATITAHHLWIVIDDVVSNAFNYCKPVAKRIEDRVALIQAVMDPSGKFFFGSDSAPHPVEAKMGKPAAGCFTQMHATQLVVAAVNEALRLGWIQDDEAAVIKALKGFLRGRGRRFYKLKESSDETPGRKILMKDRGALIQSKVRNMSGTIEIVPFRVGKEILSLTWQEPVPTL